MIDKKWWYTKPAIFWTYYWEGLGEMIRTSWETWSHQQKRSPSFGACPPQKETCKDIKKRWGEHAHVWSEEVKFLFGVKSFQEKTASSLGWSTPPRCVSAGSRSPLGAWITSGAERATKSESLFQRDTSLIKKGETMGKHGKIGKIVVCNREKMGKLHRS